MAALEIVIWQSELAAMARLTTDWGNIETGGECFGLFSRAGRPTVLLVTPPGPRAIHQRARFVQDTDHLNRAIEKLYRRFGIQPGGTFHSHHTIGLNSPSSVDMGSARSLAEKTDSPGLFQIITTVEDVSPNGGTGHRHGRAYHREGSSRAKHGSGGIIKRILHRLNPFDGQPRHLCHPGFKVRINAFVYPETPSSRYQGCPIKVLPGTSPFRDAIERLPGWQSLRMKTDFPHSQILLDPVDRPESTDNEAVDLPDRVLRQISKLPEEMAVETRIRFDNELVCLKIPVSDDYHLILFMDADSNFRILNALLGSKNIHAKPVDITTRALRFGDKTPIDHIHQIAVKLIDRNRSKPEVAAGGLAAATDSPRPLGDEYAQALKKRGAGREGQRERSGRDGE